MKLGVLIVAMFPLATIAHAETFDLVCSTKLKTEITGRPSSQIDQEMRYTLDTDNKTIIRRQGTDQTPLALEVRDDRYSFQIGTGTWVIDRATNRISSALVTSVFSHTLTGDCLKQPPAPN